MSRKILFLSAAALICASSQIALADESGTVTGAVGGTVAAPLLGVRSQRSWAASEAQLLGTP
jgi:hypothetical protein